MVVVRHTWACQKQFLILNLQYVKIDLYYDTNFLILVNIHKNSEFEWVISSRLTVWCLNFDPRVLLINQIVWFSNINYVYFHFNFTFYGTLVSLLEPADKFWSLMVFEILCLVPYLLQGCRAIKLSHKLPEIIRYKFFDYWQDNDRVGSGFWVREFYIWNPLP